MNGMIFVWGRSSRNERPWSLGHLWARDVETGIDKGHQAHCGFDPTRELGPGGGVLFRPAALDAVRCRPCAGAWGYIEGHVYYPLGEHPADLARAGR